jgi:hypothetical protein
VREQPGYPLPDPCQPPPRPLITAQPFVLPCRPSHQRTIKVLNVIEDEELGVTLAAAVR